MKRPTPYREAPYPRGDEDFEPGLDVRREGSVVDDPDVARLDREVAVAPNPLRLEPRRPFPLTRHRRRLGELRRRSRPRPDPRRRRNRASSPRAFRVAPL